MAFTEAGKLAAARGLHDAGPFKITLYGYRKVTRRRRGLLGLFGFTVTRIELAEIPDCRQRLGLKIEGCELVNCDAHRWEFNERTHASQIGILDRYGVLLTRGPLDGLPVMHVLNPGDRLEIRPGELRWGVD